MPTPSRICQVCGQPASKTNPAMCLDAFCGANTHIVVRGSSAVIMDLDGLSEIVYESFFEDEKRAILKMSQSLKDHSNAQRFGRFPELTIEQNRVIWAAREKGWDEFWPSYPSAMSQAENTVRGAEKFLKSVS